MKPQAAPSGGGPKVIIIKKKAKGHGGHHGGAWKVAYADFVTAMMALFMVMWLLSQTDQETRQKLSEYFRTGMFSGAPSVLNGGSGVQDRAFFDVVGRSSMQPEAAAFEQIALAVRAKMQRTTDENPELKDLAKNVRVSVTEDGLLITIIDGGKDLMFDSSSSELRPRLVALLEVLAPVLAQLDNQIQVHGHTDARSFPKGSNRTNWQLSFERADNARAVLERSGLRKGQVAGVFAHGDSALINSKEPFAAENRRLALLAVRRGLEKVAARGTKQTKAVEIEGDPLPPKAKEKSDAPEADQ
ncbi:MAG TPA: flagellar motor protein MotB [Polyangiaceae bacterium]|jgi:chemotaxis protein MotB|nr:flagellar motor protein MotB [Polyangiaceae bacterium]